MAGSENNREKDRLGAQRQHQALTSKAKTTNSLITKFVSIYD